MSDQPRAAGHFVAPIKDAVVAVDAVKVSTAKPRSLWSEAWHDLRKRPTFWLALLIMFVVLLMAVWPTLFTQTPPERRVLPGQQQRGPAPRAIRSASPSRAATSGRASCGARARRSSWASSRRSSARPSASSWAPSRASTADGSTSLLSRVGDIFFAIPYILAAVVVMTVFSQNRTPLTLAFAIGGFAWASTARVVRAEVLRVRQSDFVTASRALGLTRFQTLVSHVVPNAIAPLHRHLDAEPRGGHRRRGDAVVPRCRPRQRTSCRGATTSARRSPRCAWRRMALIYPSIALTVTVLAFIMLGELIRDALDPRARASR